MTNAHPGSSSPPCPRCRAALSQALGGLCPSCLLGVALEPPGPLAQEPLPEEHEGLPRPFGPYVLLRRLGQGGMGVVYEVSNGDLRREALKMMRPGGALDSEDAVRRFRDEARKAARLEHPNIVPIYAAGEHEGRHFYTMKLMEGGSLAGQMQRFRSPRAAARLLVTIARAVGAWHEQGMVHRDLKPANLLFDALGVPYVADFGVARSLHQEPRLTQTGMVVGTHGYMAPEQARPRGQELTLASDVFSLGVILYELLTTRPPFDGHDADEVRERVLNDEPAAPRVIDPRIPADLETICVTCLEKRPSRRYGSASALADDLQRYLDGEPILARPVGRLERVWRWVQRHPLGAGLLATLFWCLSVAAVGAVSIAGAQAADLRRDALRANVYAARLVAGAVLFELAQYSKAVERAAAEPALVAALQARDAKALESLCQQHFTYYDSPSGGLKPVAGGAPFVLWYVQDTRGLALAGWPRQPTHIIGRTYDFRDYFLGARRLAREGQRVAYLSRAFLSEGDGKYAFALASPVYASDGTWLGVLVGTVAVNSTLGSFQLNEPSDSSRTATLVALMDRARGQDHLPPRDVYAVLVHERLGRGMPATLEPLTARQLERALPEPSPDGRQQLQRSAFGGRELEGYRDPVSGDPGAWLAAFAPVGNTGFAVIVQTQEDAVLAANAQLARRIAWWGRPFVLGVGLVWLVFLLHRFQSRRAARRP